MPDAQEWELPPEAPGFLLSEEQARALFPEIANTTNTTNTINNFDFSMIPDGPFEMTWDGEPFVERGDRTRLDVDDDGFLEKYVNPAYASSSFYHGSHPTEPMDCETIEELEICERNIRKLIALFDLPGVVTSDNDWGYAASLDEFKANLASIPEVREDILRDMADVEAEANSCNGYLNRTTGVIEHSGSPICPIHAK